MTATLVTLAPDDQVDGYYAGPEHLTVDLGEVQLLMSHEQARALRAKLDELL